MATMGRFNSQATIYQQYQLQDILLKNITNKDTPETLNGKN